MLEFRMMKRLTIVALLIGLGMAAGACHRGRSSPAIATVNGEDISMPELDQFIKARMGELTAADSGDSIKSQMLDEYITRRVVLAEAARAGLAVTDAEIDQAEHPQVKSLAPTSDARREFARDLLVTKYYKQVVLRDVRVSPEEAQEYIEQHHARLIEPAGFFVREIRVDTKDEAERLRREATQGRNDFGTLARQYSQAPNAEQGGMARYDKGQLPDVLEKGIDPLRPGDVSPVIQSSFGFHIFKMERRIQPHAPEDKRAQLDDPRSRLIEEAIERKNQKEVDAALERLTSSAAVKINESVLGFTYVGKLRHN
jgi:parvulin-like peptidyl-prolyl isomerase